MIHFLVPADQEFGFADYLAAHGGGGLRERCAILHYGTLPSNDAFAPGTYVFSAIDQLTPAMRELAGTLHDALSTAPGGRLLNHPIRTLRRFELLTTLKDLGRNQQLAVRATEDWSALRYPVFLRSERRHVGNLSPLLGTPGEIEAAIGRALIKGDSLDDLVVVEFVETADRSGLYRQYSAFVVGDRVLARHLAVGTRWMMKHSGVTYSPELAREHLEFVESNPHETDLREIAAIAHVEYGRIDYAIKDGRVNVWEINLNPTIGPRAGEARKPEPPEVHALRDRARTLFYDGLRDALEAVDVCPSLPRIPVSFDPRVVRAALAPPRRSTVVPALRSTLRPVNPVVKPLVEIGAQVVGRIARAVRNRR
jgi:hypothetical protein